MVDFLLLETGDALLLETGDNLLLETEVIQVIGPTKTANVQFHGTTANIQYNKTTANIKVQ